MSSGSGTDLTVSTSASEQGDAAAARELEQHCRTIAKEVLEGKVVPVLGAGVNICEREPTSGWSTETSAARWISTSARSKEGFLSAYSGRRNANCRCTLVRSLLTSCAPRRLTLLGRREQPASARLRRHVHSADAPFCSLLGGSPCGRSCALSARSCSFVGWGHCSSLRAASPAAGARNTRFRAARSSGRSSTFERRPGAGSR